MRALAVALLLFSSIRPATVDALPAPQNLQVVETGEGWARFRWDAVDDPRLKGYRLEYSLRPNSHAPMWSWNGHAAAFSFTTDDGFDDNLTYREVFDRHDRHFTAFVIPSRVGTPGYLRPEDLDALHEAGHEIGSHGMNHVVLIRDDAFTIRYEGEAGHCWFEIASDTLRTWLDGPEPDLELALEDPSVLYLADLVDRIDADPYYACELDYYPCTFDYCQSKYLVDTGPWDIKAGPVRVRTEKGCDSLALASELADSKTALEELVTDPDYRCRTVAYPRHAHDQREMNAAMEAGYLAARNGTNVGTYPGFAPVTLNYLDRVSLYQTPMTWGQPPNDSTEEWSRGAIRQRIAAWKRDGEWALLYLAHTLADWDSAHVDWVLDEIVADGDVWVAPFGEVAEYVRRFQVTVENPVEEWNESRTASAPLHRLPAGSTLYVVVVAYDESGGESEWSNEVVLQTGGQSTNVGGGPPSPSNRFSLDPARPNPMNPVVTIPFTVKESVRVALRVHDVNGRLVATLLDAPVAAGPHEVVWRGTDRLGREAGSGVYFCRLDTPWGATSRRIDLVR
ncbi:MAG: hypothetical protein EHM19_08185 [Candidatus Latescibacterota bacterium]|nr:MAG: hypothetical protein EHM19_08185 [Candidatus Latescibacterota bacterium]